MTDEVRIELQPLGEHLKVPRGTPLREILFDYGVEFPCGGRGQCRGCRIRVAEGSLEVTPPQRQVLRPQEIEEGWRLSCQCRAEGDMRLEMAQWKADILVDDSLFEFSPGKGLGIAIDLGTTTVVVQLLDLETGRVLGVRTALNAQARHGADVMSRVEFAVSGGGRKTLTDVIRHQIGTLIRQVLAHSLVPIDDKAPDNGAAAWRESDLTQIVIVGNTVIHHLFCGIDPEPLSHYPFEPMEIGLYKFQARELGWDLESNPVVRFLPCLGGFVGADTLAGILAIRMHESRDLVGLVDLGTNGEIVFGNSERMICASTAAGLRHLKGRASGWECGLRPGQSIRSRHRMADCTALCWGIPSHGESVVPAWWMRLRSDWTWGELRPAGNSTVKGNILSSPIPWRFPRLMSASCSWPRRLSRPESSWSWNGSGGPTTR
ncbi:MAG: 2Fe-2S iron-sulfur cluster binding domain-containing protein [Candidatus Omnitrophica bacterium]|nr:2Fe-2S iron-sulfur cluster binding domain-containing protein [Candidatus Omnitrophota bacterium]